MDLFLNTEIINRDNPSTLSDLANAFFAPAHYLFEGNKIVISQGNVIRDESCFASKNNYVRQEKDYGMTAVTVAAFIPGVILGTITKFFAILLSRHLDDIAIVKQFYESKRVVFLPNAPRDITFGEYRRQYCARVDAVLAIVGEDKFIWRDSGFIQEFSTLMEDGYKYMDLYFKKLAQECQNNPVRMRNTMIIQPQNRTQPGQEDYSHTFFLFTELYHYARGCATRQNRAKWAERRGIGGDEPMPFENQSLLTNEDQEPYFNPTKPQYHWRELYNAFCAQMDARGLRTLLEERGAGDMRYSNWSRPDTKKVWSFYFPDSTLT